MVFEHLVLPISGRRRKLEPIPISKRAISFDRVKRLPIYSWKSHSWGVYKVVHTHVCDLLGTWKSSSASFSPPLYVLTWYLTGNQSLSTCRDEDLLNHKVTALKCSSHPIMHVIPEKARCSPRTRTCRILVWNGLFEQSSHFFPVTVPMHCRLWNMEQGGVQSVECGM